jgi:cytidylate kinase
MPVGVTCEFVESAEPLAELTANGENVTFEEVLQNPAKRNLIDTTRKDGPLRQADDAVVIDISSMIFVCVENIFPVWKEVSYRHFEIIGYFS